MEWELCRKITGNRYQKNLSTPLALWISLSTILNQKLLDIPDYFLN